MPHLTPGGLDDVFDQVVPLLQERGSFRTEYAGTTLREHLGLARPGTTRGDGEPTTAHPAELVG
ncbi:FMNH2-utilizing oxygenase [Mycobacteroides abscessus]|nr:FMNH2-utilizing oxygenase [Mycobacteroides abscessus]